MYDLQIGGSKKEYYQCYFLQTIYNFGVVKWDILLNKALLLKVLLVTKFMANLRLVFKQNVTKWLDIGISVSLALAV